MKTLPLAAALTLAAWLISSIAQNATTPPLPAASVPTESKPAPKALSPAALRESATPPGDLRPEDPVRPQINIPLGRKPVASLAAEPRAQRRIGSASAAAGGIDDASARCEAEVDTQARLACRGKLAQTAAKR